MFDLLLQAATQAGANAGKGNMLMTIVPFVLIFVVFYFFLIRPQNKKQKETEKMIAALKKGDKVVTIGEIQGVVTNTKEETIVIRVDDNAKIEINRSAVSAVIGDKVEKKEEKPEEKKLFGFFKKNKKKDAEEKSDSKVEKLSDNPKKSDEKVEDAKVEEEKKDEAAAESNNEAK